MTVGWTGQAFVAGAGPPNQIHFDFVCLVDFAFDSLETSKSEPSSLGRLSVQYETIEPGLVETKTDSALA